jgi:hypothetical protein
MTDFFDQLESQLARAADARAGSASRRRLSVPRWIRSLPVLAAAGVAVVVVVGALALLHHGSAVNAANGPVPASELTAGVPYFRKAMLQERSCWAGVRKPALPATSTGSPGSGLLSLLGVLRRPATAADRLPRSLQDGPDARGIYVHYIRLARVSGGISYYILPAEAVQNQGGIPDRCWALVLAAVKAELPRVPSADRSATLALAERQITFARRARRSAGPGVCLLAASANGNAGTCGATAQELKQGGLVAGEARLSGIVPDGVAKVTVDYPAAGGRPARTVTADVVGNVFVTSLDAGGAARPRLVWRSPAGSVIATVPAGARNGGSSAFCSGGGIGRNGHRHPAFC